VVEILDAARESLGAGRAQELPRESAKSRVLRRRSVNPCSEEEQQPVVANYIRVQNMAVRERKSSRAFQVEV
jgi:hypothetical protein